MASTIAQKHLPFKQCMTHLNIFSTSPIFSPKYEDILEVHVADFGWSPPVLFTSRFLKEAGNV